MSKSCNLGDMPSQAGRRFLITGANSGIGFWTAVELARHGAVVVMACRDEMRGRESLKLLRAEATGNGSAAGEAELVLLDLASLDSVRRVAEAELERNTSLHGLINNAGVMSTPKRRETVDGFELQFGTNVLGHFALTCRLMRALELGRAASISEASRVVTVSSIAHKRGRLNFDDLQAIKGYQPMEAYAQSKLGNLMFSFELEHRLRAAMMGSVSIAVHPGVAQTSLFKVGSSTGLAGMAEKVLQWGIGATLNSTVGGAVPTLFAATAKEALGGGYYGPQGLNEMRGGDVGLAEVAPQAKDREAQRRLWEVCSELTGVGI